MIRRNLSDNSRKVSEIKKNHLKWHNLAFKHELIGQVSNFVEMLHTIELLQKLDKFENLWLCLIEN